MPLLGFYDYVGRVCLLILKRTLIGVAFVEDFLYVTIHLHSCWGRCSRFYLKLHDFIEWSLVQAKGKAEELRNKAEEVAPGPVKKAKTGPCSHCWDTVTPQWRRGPGDKSTCNACGVRF